MILEQTKDKLYKMKLGGMVEALNRILTTSEYSSLPFEDILGLLVEDEWLRRENKKMNGRIQKANFRCRASIEEIDYHVSRNLDKKTILSLMNCEWIKQKQNLLITGPTGVGKTFLASALGNLACKNGFTVMYFRATRLFGELYQSRADGSYLDLLNKMEKTNLLILDDFGLISMKEHERKDLLEIVEERYKVGSTIICGQLPHTKWHAYIGDMTIADAICDRLIHNSHQIILEGESMRKLKSDLGKEESLAQSVDLAQV